MVSKIDHSKIEAHVTYSYVAALKRFCSEAYLTMYVVSKGHIIEIRPFHLGQYSEYYSKSYISKSAKHFLVHQIYE